jgi:hypothetical protein
MAVARLCMPQLLPAAILSAGPVRPQGAQRLLADDGRNGAENQGHGNVVLALAAADHRSTRGGQLPSAVRYRAEGVEEREAAPSEGSEGLLEGRGGHVLDELRL